MLRTAFLLLPDFRLIVAGFLICRHTALDRVVWGGVERLVYWLLFPVLLFVSIVRSPLDPAATLGLATGGVLTVAVGIGLATALRALPGVDPHRQASGAQVAFRFNSYVALALAERVGGAPGVAWTALLIALCVPLCNVGAVWSLARHGGHDTGRELLRNPLILATVGGLVANLAGLTLPRPVDVALGRIGAAALPLGLMAVGAGLTFGGLRRGWPRRCWRSGTRCCRWSGTRWAWRWRCQPGRRRCCWRSRQCRRRRAATCWPRAWAATPPTSPGW